MSGHFMRRRGVPRLVLAALAVLLAVLALGPLAAIAGRVEQRVTLHKSIPALDEKPGDRVQLNGDLEIGAKISEGEIDVLVFFWDPLAAQPHDPDVRALLRIVVVWNIPVVSNMASADFMFSSPFMSGEYKRLVPDYEERKRKDWPLMG